MYIIIDVRIGIIYVENLNYKLRRVYFEFWIKFRKIVVEILFNCYMYIIIDVRIGIIYVENLNYKLRRVYFEF